MAKGMMGDPDKGPQMKEGAHTFDKGYTSDEEKFSPRGLYPHDHERGNKYFELMNGAQKKDSAKLSRSKFSKVA